MGFRKDIMEWHLTSELLLGKARQYMSLYMLQRTGGTGSSQITIITNESGHMALPGDGQTPLSSPKHLQSPADLFASCWFYYSQPLQQKPAGQHHRGHRFNTNSAWGRQVWQCGPLPILPALLPVARSARWTAMCRACPWSLEACKGRRIQRRPHRNKHA